MLFNSTAIFLNMEMFMPKTILNQFWKIMSLFYEYSLQTTYFFKWYFPLSLAKKQKQVLLIMNI